MIIYLERKKRLFRKNVYVFKHYDKNTNNYKNIDLDNIIKNKNQYILKLEKGQIDIYKKNNKIIINIINSLNNHNNYYLLYKFKINKLGDCGFLKSNKNTIISHNNLPLFKIGKINSNQFKIIFNIYNLSNINNNIYNNYICIIIIISLLLFN